MDLRDHIVPSKLTPLTLAAVAFVSVALATGLLGLTVGEPGWSMFRCLLPMTILSMLVLFGPVADSWLDAEWARRRTAEPDSIELGREREWPHAPVRLERHEREGHSLILGRAGSGKSTLMKWMIEQDIAHRRPVVVIDPHSSLADQCAYLAMTHNVLPIVLEAHPEYMNTLNLLEPRPGYGPLEASRTVMEGLVQVYLPYLDELPMRLRNVLGTASYLLASADEGFTVLELPRFVLQKDFREYIARRARRMTSGQRYLESVQALTSLQWLESLSRSQRHDQEQSTWSRLIGLLMHPDAQRLIGTSKSTFNFDEVRRGVPLLAGIGERGLYRTGHILNSLIITWMTNMLLNSSSTGAEHPRLGIYADELAEASPESFERLLHHARKAPAWLTLISQAQNLLHPNFAHNVMANISNLLILGLSGPAVEDLAREITRPAREPGLAGWDGRWTSLSMQLHQMASTIRDLPKHEVLLWRATRPGRPQILRTGSVRWVVPGLAQVARDEALRLRGRPVSDIDNEIRARTAKLDAQFGPLHPFGRPSTPDQMAPW